MVDFSFPVDSKYIECKYKKQNGNYIISDSDPKRTVYRPDKNDIYIKKGGIERAMERIGELAEKKAELTEKGSKIAGKFTKILEFCKKYGKSLKA